MTANTHGWLSHGGAQLLALACCPLLVAHLSCSPDEAQLIGDQPGGGGSGGQSTSSGSGAGASGAGGVGGAGSCSGPELLNDDARLPPGLAQELLDMHNAKRLAYCLEPMVWDCNLAAVAQAYAELGAGNLPHNADRHDQYASLVGCTSNCPQLGENIAWHQPYDFFPLDDGVVSWLSEEDPQSCNEGGSHYTQIVWETATKVGCGVWIDDSDGTKLHLVCNYIEFQLSGAAFTIGNCTGCN